MVANTVRRHGLWAINNRPYRMRGRSKRRPYEGGHEARPYGMRGRSKRRPYGL